MRELKELTRYQNRLIHDRSKAKILYVHVLDIIFPELAKIVTSPHNQYVYELLTRYPSASKIRQAPFDALLKIKRLKANKAIKSSKLFRRQQAIHHLHYNWN